MLKLRLLSTLLAALLGSCGGQAGKGHSVLLITLDTTSAGALSCYGALPGLTPHLDRLAREGVVYDNARTVAPLTGPAHASMLTGLYPPRHGVRVNASMALPEAARTLAEEVGPRGVATGAVIAAPPDSKYTSTRLRSSHRQATRAPPPPSRGAQHQLPIPYNGVSWRFRCILSHEVSSRSTSRNM